MPTLQEMTKALATAAAAEPASSKTLVIDMGEDGRIRIAGAVVDNTGGAADCTIHVSKADFEQIVSGELDPSAAFMSGKLRVDGDVGVAMALQAVIGRAFG